MRIRKIVTEPQKLNAVIVKHSPCQYHMKSKENSAEKNNFNIRVLRINSFASLA